MPHTRAPPHRTGRPPRRHAGLLLLRLGLHAPIDLRRRQRQVLAAGRRPRGGLGGDQGGLQGGGGAHQAAVRVACVLGGKAGLSSAWSLVVIVWHCLERRPCVLPASPTSLHPSPTPPQLRRALRDVLARPPCLLGRHHARRPRAGRHLRRAHRLPQADGGHRRDRALADVVAGGAGGWVAPHALRVAGWVLVCLWTGSCCHAAYTLTTISNHLLKTEPPSPPTPPHPHHPPPQAWASPTAPTRSTARCTRTSRAAASTASRWIARPAWGW
jgi:hypothetical protein